MLDAVTQGLAAKAAMMQVASRFMALPRWTKVAAVAGVMIVVVGAVSIPVAAVAVDAHNRELSFVAEADAAAAERESAAEVAAALAEAKEAAAGLNAEYAGLTVLLAAAVHPDAAAAFEAARVQLALAIASGGSEDLSAAAAGLTDALHDLVASAKGQADGLIAASPLAGASLDALTQAVTDLATADDVAAALTRVKAASEAVVAAQQAAADAAARQAAEAEATAGQGPSGGGAPGGDPTGAVTWGGPFPDPAIMQMHPGPREWCGPNPTGQVVTLQFGWDARPGNTVDIYYALTDGDYLATSGFILLASGLGTSGSVSIPVTCPVGPGPTQLITVRAVANNENGSVASHYWGL